MSDVFGHIIFSLPQVRAVAVINPGNPTGNVLETQSLHDIVSLCAKHNIVLLADEVYQENVYAEGKEFTAFREVVLQQKSDCQLFSFHSMSKGYYGECGLRGGYALLTNIDKGVAGEMLKLLSMVLCSNTVGQSMIASIVNPPVEGEE